MIRKDEQIGPFTVRVRTIKEGPVATAFIPGGPQEYFRGHANEDAALDAARAWATEHAPAYRIVTKRAAKPRAMPTLRQSVDDLKTFFLKHFPGGFSDEAYLGPKGERGVKLAAKAVLEGVLTPEAALSATPEQCLAIKPAFRGDLFHRVELAKVGDMLATPEAPAFLRGAALVTRGEVAAGLNLISESVGQHMQPSWTLATYLPSLWDASRNIALKIQATQTVAGWMGHRFCVDYAAQLDPAVHASLHDFAQKIEAAIADLKPRDMIDVQSFIWVVARYR
jgi:hypothetical protein